MAGSRIVAVRSAAIDGLALLGGLADVDVRFQYRSDQSVRERIFTRGARFNHTAASLRAGRNFRNEVGGFEIVLLVEGVDMTQEATSERALELGVLVEEFIADRKNNELGVDGLQTLVIDGDGELNEMFNDRGHLAELTYPVRYTARLT